MVLPPWPHFDEEMLEAAQKVLRSGKVNYWTGTEGREFEREFAEYTGSRYAIALANGTIALEIPLRALGIGPGDEVIVTPRTFVASASCPMLVGAKPVFADVDPQSGNLTAETIEAVLTPRTKAVIVVHLAGWPCEMAPIMELAHRHGLKVVEDCAQAHGARIDGRSVGTFGHVAAWSFCQDKIITTAGEGGMITTDDPDLYEKMWSLKDHGKNRRKAFEKPTQPGFRWLHDGIGHNGRLTELQAAIGRVALRRLDGWIERRTQNAIQLMDALDGDLLHFPRPRAGLKHAYYKLYGNVRPGVDRDRLLSAMESQGVPGLSGTCCEVYREGVFASAGLSPVMRLPVAQALSNSGVMFLVHPTMGPEHMEEMAARVQRAGRLLQVGAAT
jgi:dTDP-4-amino-4,6-dideoxygalactose transaminase